MSAKFTLINLLHVILYHYLLWILISNQVYRLVAPLTGDPDQ